MAQSQRKNTGSNNTLALPEIKDWHAIVAICLSAAIFFRDILLQKAFFWEDFLYQYYPNRFFAAVSMSRGELPLWNPFTFNGTPFQADMQSALFYIPNLLLTFFVSDGRLSAFWVELFIIIHFMIAGVSMYYLAKDFGLPRFASLFSGMVYMFSGFMITHAIHQVIICQVAWLPLILLLFRKMFHQRSLLWMIAGGLVLGHAVLAGFPQVSLYIFFFIFLYFVFEYVSCIRQNGWKAGLLPAILAAGMIVISIGFTALQLLPTIELAPLSQRAEITYEKSLEGVMSWGQLVTMIVPKFFGSSGAQGSNYWGPGVYWAYWETSIYVGIPALVFIIFSTFAFRKNKYVAFFCSIVVFTLLYSVGDGFILHKFFFYVVPGFSKFRSIGRITLLLALSAAMLSGFGIQVAFDFIGSSRKKFQQIIFAAGGVGILLWIAVQSGFLQPSETSQLYPQVHSSAVSETTTALIFIIVTIGILFLLGRKTIGTAAAILLLLLVQFVDVHMFGFDQNNSSTDPKEYYGRTSGLVNMLKEDGAHEYFRINARQGGAMLLDRNQGMVDQIFLMEGYTPLSLQRFTPPGSSWSRICDLMNAKYRIVVDESQRKMNIATSTTYLPRAFFVSDAKIIPDDAQQKAFMESDAFSPAKTVVLDDDPHFPLTSPPDSMRGTVTITSYHLNSIILDVTAPHNGFLVLSEVYYPGWHAYDNGTQSPLYRGDWNLRTIPVREGKHSIEVRFEPDSFRRGAWITAATIGLSLVGIVYSVVKKRSKPPSA